MSERQLDEVRRAVLAQAREQAGSRPAGGGGWSDSIRLVGLHAVIVGLSVWTGGWLLAAHVDGRWHSAAAVALVIVAGTIAGVSPRVRRAHFGVVLLGGVVAWITVSASAGHEAATWALHDAQCVAAELGVSAIPCGATLLVLRRFSCRIRRAFVAGLGAGATGLLVLDLSCPIDGPAHALAYHVAPWLLVAAVVALVRARLRPTSFVP